jgi:NADH:ubiquinone oxidoreductase subunit 3 (subunit A)
VRPASDVRSFCAVPSQYAPLLLAFIVAVVLGVILLSLAGLAGRSKATGGRVKESTYESGLPLLDQSRKRISVLFFLIAIDFVIFDVEAAFLYPWALVFREGSWPLFGAVMVFIALILVGFFYVWRKGGLDLSLGRASTHPAARSGAIQESEGGV